jgi:2-polyprenyl-3-methyl-5-hydroxy-6-metoxy-1,4-benzoquinol methylase
MIAAALSGVYQAVNEPVLARVPAHARRILDLGCGSGTFGLRLKQRQECEVVGVTISGEEAISARGRLDQVLVQDLNEFEPEASGNFDCVVCSHVLEHLYRPERLLVKLAAALAAGGVVVVALPNIVYWKQRLAFLRGSFRYMEGGLMDRTHLRFFDWQTAFELLNQAGYEVIERAGDGGFPLPGIRRVSRSAAALIDRMAVRLMPNVFAWQCILVARPLRAAISCAP